MDDIKKQDLNVYERVHDLISKVKLIENELMKNKFAKELEKIYLDIKKIKAKYEIIDAKDMNAFIQEKKQVEIAIALKLDELENEYDLFQKEGFKQIIQDGLNTKSNIK